MSDILIKNMKLPESCSKCPLSRSGCSAVIERVKTLEQMPWIPLNYRHDDCPLVEVPTPHGDLIDRMALLEAIKEARKKDPEIEDVYIDDYFTVAEWVVSAPTIIEAEGE